MSVKLRTLEVTHAREPLDERVIFRCAERERAEAIHRMGQATTPRPGDAPFTHGTYPRLKVSLEGVAMHGTAERERRESMRERERLAREVLVRLERLCTWCRHKEGGRATSSDVDEELPLDAAAVRSE